MSNLSKVRNFNKIQDFTQYIIKSSSNDKLCYESLYYDHIEKIYPQLQIFFPRKLKIVPDSIGEQYISESDKKYYLCLEKYPYTDLGESFSSVTVRNYWSTVFWELFTITSRMSAMPLETIDIPTKEQITSSAYQMYIEKTETEWNSFKKLYTNFNINGVEKINNYSVKSFDDIWNTIKTFIIKYMLTFKPSIIHGDLCLSNILYESNCGLKFIDMRGSFGNMIGVVGDIRYDLAKLDHSIYGGYDLIISDKFTFSNSGNSYFINCELPLLNRLEFIRDIYKIHRNVYLSSTIPTDDNANFKLENLKIKIIQGTIFIGMCARHSDSEVRQAIMYLQGLHILNKCYESILEGNYI